MADVVINTKTSVSVSEADEAVKKLGRSIRDAKLELKELDKTSEDYAKKKKQVDDLTSTYNKQKDALVDLKQETKEQEKALKEQEKAMKKTAEVFAETKDKMGDLKDEANLLQGSGVERLNNSFGLMREGLENADFEKVKTGFKGIGAAMSAVPILLLVEGFKLLVENWGKVVDGFKTVFNLFSDGEKNVKALTKELKNMKEANELATVGLANEIRVLEAQGKSNAEIIAKKKELNALKIKELEIDLQLQKAKIQEVIDNDSITESYYRLSAATLRKMGLEEKADAIDKLINLNKVERAQEFLDRFKADAIAIQNLKTDAKVEEIKANKEDAKIHQDKIDQKKKLRDETLKTMTDAMDAAEQETKKEEEELQKRRDLYQKYLGDKEKADAEYDANESERRKQAEKEKEESDKKLADEKKAAKQKAVQESYDIENASLSSLQAISDTYFSIKQANAQSLSAEEEAAAKKQFQINKGLQLATASMNGIQAVTAILSVPDFTWGIASALRIAAVVGTTAGAIARIAATQFNTSGYASSVKPTAPTSSGIKSGGGSMLPSNQSLPQTKQESTEFDSQGNKKNNDMRVVLLYSDIKEADRTMTRIVQQSKV